MTTFFVLLAILILWAAAFVLAGVLAILLCAQVAWISWWVVSKIWRRGR